MLAQGLDREFQNAAVDLADEAELLDEGDEFAGRHDAPIVGPHPEKALVKADGTLARQDHGLEGECQAVGAECRLYLLHDPHVAAHAMALVFGEPVEGELVATATLGLQLGGNRPGDDVKGGLGRPRKDDATDRNGDRHRAGPGLYGRLAHRQNHPLGRRLGLGLIATVEQHAELVALDATDHVTGADATIQPLAQPDDDRIADGVTESVVDHAEIVDIDDQERACRAMTFGLGHRVLHGIAQACLVEMAGQLVEVGQILEPLGALLALGDDPECADHAQRVATGVDLGHAAVMHPSDGAVLAPEPILAVERHPGGEMTGQRFQAHRQVAMADAGMKAVAGADRLRRGVPQNRRDRAVPANGVAGKVPVVDQVAGGVERRLDTAQCVVGLGHTSVLLGPRFRPGCAR